MLAFQPSTPSSRDHSPNSVYVCVSMYPLLMDVDGYILPLLCTHIANVLLTPLLPPREESFDYCIPLPSQGRFVHTEVANGLGLGLG